MKLFQFPWKHLEKKALRYARLPAVNLNPVKLPEIQFEWTDRLNVWNL